MPKGGALVISLDFELMWGVRDKRTLADYGANILGVRDAVPAMLDLFAERNIACTWATVGFLFFRTKRELAAAVPHPLPNYADSRLTPYGDIGNLGDGEDADPYHFGRSLLDRVRAYPHQEIGTHTFSHFYCLEQGASLEAFRADLTAAKRVAADVGVTLRSIVFPRNQVSTPHLRICRELGFTAFRGNERVWFHGARRDAEQTLLVRGFRLADSYLPLAGAHAHEPAVIEGMVDVPASRFLRPVRRDGFGEALRLRRIVAAMDTAAREDRIFHLWWHPHNFGVDLKANMTFLRSILDQYRNLEARHGMRSMTMGMVAAEVLDAA